MNTQIFAPYFKLESFGAVDGPGIRMVLFLQGCPYRCLFCHNPESWEFKKSGAMMISANELISKYLENESYYKQNGGITLSGGEPLMHLQFCKEVCKLAKEKGISVALDTSAANFIPENYKEYEAIASYDPMWLVDIKHINPKKHKTICGVAEQRELKLIEFLEQHKQVYWVRQVLLPGYTDDHKDLAKLGQFLGSLKYMKKFEILPYHTLGVSKYEALHLKYALKGVKEPTKEQLKKVMKIITENMKHSK